MLIDSKVVIGAVTKGRSSSLPLNGVLRRIASLCFAGGLILRCVFVLTSHNPGDWPSRGDASTWPRELRSVGIFSVARSRCRACGMPAWDHPRDQPNRSRGTGLPCRGLGTRHAYDHEERRWISDLDLCIRRMCRATGSSDTFRSELEALLLDDTADGGRGGPVRTTQPRGLGNEQTPFC